MKVAYLIFWNGKMLMIYWWDARADLRIVYAIWIHSLKMNENNFIYLEMKFWNDLHRIEVGLSLNNSYKW